MNFEFSSDQMLLKDQARKFLEGEESLKKARFYIVNLKCTFSFECTEAVGAPAHSGKKHHAAP